MKSTDLWVNWACWSGEAWNKAWGAKWLHLRYLFCKCVPSGPRTPAKVWHSVTNLLWLVPELHWNKVVDRAVGVGVQALNGRISLVVSDFLLLIIFKDLFSHLSCSPFASLFLLHPPLSLPCCTSSSVIFEACAVGDSYAERHHQHTLIPSYSLLRTFILFILLSCPSLCLCSPGSFLVLYFQHCQSLLLKAFVTAHPSHEYFLLHVTLCSFA